MRVFRIVLLVLTIVISQHTIFSSIQIFGVHLDLPLLLVIAAGFTLGREGGAIVGFVVGILVDSYLLTPFGLSALVFSVLGYLAGQTEKGSLIGPWTMNAALASLLSAFGVLVYEIISRLLGVGLLLRINLVKAVLVVAVTNALISVVMVPLVKWAFSSRDSNSRPPTIRY